MPTKYNRQRHIRTQMIGQKPGSISVPNKAETMAQITEKLNNARQLLLEKQAENDTVAVKRLTTIIENLQSTLDR